MIRNGNPAKLNITQTHVVVAVVDVGKHFERQVEGVLEFDIGDVQQLWAGCVRVVDKYSQAERSSSPQEERPTKSRSCDSLTQSARASIRVEFGPNSKLQSETNG